MGDPRTIVDVFDQNVEQYASRVALRVKRDGRYVDVRWDEFGERVRQFSLGLIRLGMKRGDHVALLSQTRPEFLFADLAILSAGAVTVPIYPTSVAEDVAYLLRHSEARLLIADTPEQLEKVRSMKRTLPQLERIILFDGEGAIDGMEAMNFDAVCQLGREADEEIRRRRAHWRAAISPDDVATIIYTSGTTGRQKGAMITHGNIMFVCRSMKELYGDFLTDEEVYLAYLPLAHALERMGVFMQIYLASTIGFAERLDTVGDDLRAVAPTGLVGVPRFYEKIRGRILEAVAERSPWERRIFSWALRVGRRRRMAEEKGQQLPLRLRLQHALARRLVFDRIKAQLGGRVRFCLSGAAPLSVEVAEFFADIGLPILEGYGATEVCGPATLNRVHHPRIGTVGPPLPGVEIAIAPDGEILIRGGNVFKGYYKDPVATERALRDGWYHSGDVGTIDAQGHLVVTDRKKDLIITSGGKNIAPQKLERIFGDIEEIHDIIIVGDGRPYLVALITLDREVIVRWARRQGLAYQDESELIAHPRVRALLEARIAEKNARLASFERIKKFAILDEDFSIEAGTLTPTMKTKRQVVARTYRHLIEALYSEDATRPHSLGEHERASRVGDSGNRTSS
ncbi:MAG: long-chain fatty acid--CoA ligase [Acidobacteria bacterium]|nr:MAG: long-chain fatty acid--CoA ligase [Acidobacteriota bacterium]